MAICLLAGTAVAKLAVTAFTLAWTHSVQKTEWQEDWTAAGGQLTLVQARIEGLGAGMDAPEGAVFDGQLWRWMPRVPPQPRVVLRNSGATSDWRLCTQGRCRPLTEITGDVDPIVIEPCAD